MGGVHLSVGSCRNKMHEELKAPQLKKLAISKASFDFSIAESQSTHHGSCTIHSSLMVFALGVEGLGNYT